MTLPTNRTTANTAAEHVADHNTLHGEFNVPTHTHSGAYVPDLGFPFTLDPRPVGTAPNLGASNRGWYTRVQNSGTITKIGLYIDVSSGNICVAVYAASGTGRSAVPAARLGTSGSVASPGTGYREISLGGSVAVPAGSFMHIVADNTSFAAAGFSGYANALLTGFSFYEDAFPAPANAGTLVASGQRSFVLIGVA